jgi:ParB-like chromosome segregation protein Spo0J
MNLEEIKTELSLLDNEEKIKKINEIKLFLHEISPFKNEPVDCVIWEKAENVVANDYNPNKVAPPEMELLKISIQQDGYTQPVVTWEKEKFREVVDGFHRTRVCKEYKEINERVMGYIPVVSIKQDCQERNNRIASTIRHNRARGKHVIQAMSDIVIELKNRNWKNERIARELGMEADEVLRLCQITGLAGLFKDDEFSKSWDIKDSASDEDYIPLDDFVSDSEKKEYNFRTVNTSDERRIFHTFDKWECYKAGFYNSSHASLTKEECEAEYARLLSNEKEFRNALNGVINEWKHSCEHYLTNFSMNRIAWLGQASLCYAKGIPSVFRSGFNLLSEEQQNIANNIALEYLNNWLVKNGFEKTSLENAMTDRQSTIY